jgi:hypothetical protein
MIQGSPPIKLSFPPIHPSAHFSSPVFRAYFTPFRLRRCTRHRSQPSHEGTGLKPARTRCPFIGVFRRRPPRRFLGRRRREVMLSLALSHPRGVAAPRGTRSYGARLPGFAAAVCSGRLTPSVSVSSGFSTFALLVSVGARVSGASRAGGAGYQCEGSYSWSSSLSRKPPRIRWKPSIQRSA